jgi:thioredoxin-related protein
MFVSSIYNFSFVPNIPWEGSQSERKASMISHYFDGIDFNDPIITRTSQINEFMNGYVNLNAQGAVNQALRDSLIPLSAKNAIEKAKQGNPVVYGWMVDYFYRGFESNNLPSGMKVLEPYLNDTKCLTSKRMEIERRLKGMESLVVGSIAPNIQLKDTDGQLFDLEKQKFEEKYTLLLFWSADCSHCIETVDGIYPWLKQPEINQKVRTIAISLDETETEVNAWEKKISELTGWKHLRASEGVRSKVAGNYFILATPVMILMDSRTKEIKGIPGTLRELNELIH